MRCTSHTLHLVVNTDASKTLNKCAIYKKYYHSAFAKAQEIWNKQSRSSKALDVIKHNISFLLQFQLQPNGILHMMQLDD